ncbi:MAG: DHH family phosphoesterase [Patescibacteria group bacterium]
MDTGYFYSKSTGLYVAREPLRTDARVIKAALDCGIQLSWDDEGRINYITFDDGLSLLRQLGATMLTVNDYWSVFKDASESKDEDMLKQLQSDKYAERLNTIVEDKTYLINNPTFGKSDENSGYLGEKKTVQMPFGHPGWFDPKDINFESGLPQKVELNREKYSTSWKYWSFCDYNYKAAAIRGWVTSVGKPSLDLGIPSNALYPVLVLRECRKQLLQPSVDPQILAQAVELIKEYEDRIKRNEYKDLYLGNQVFLSFIERYGIEFQKSRETEICKIREKITEILGILRVIAKTNNDNPILGRINDVARRLSGVEEDIQFRNFVSFIRDSKKRLQEALAVYKPVVFVMGHKNPDTDTVVSALAESYRNHLTDGENTVYVPVIQGTRIPDEAKRLLGSQIADHILLSEELLYRKVRDSGQARWIMVDHNKDTEIQKFAVSIIDHHVPSEAALKQRISKTLEMTGSTTALIVQKINGLGINMPKPLARILYGATLMDTENRSELKMTAKDKFIMDDLKKTSGIENDSEFYQDLMSFLLNTDFAELLFARDYKEDWTFFGFAVAKAKGIFGADGRILKGDLMARLVNLAKQNNADKNLSLTIIKVVDYREDNETINRERIYLVFNDDVFPEFKKTMFDLVSTVIDHTFKGKMSVKKGDNFIEFWGVGDQLSRKKTAPLLEPVVSAFNEYFFSPAVGLYVRRDFLKTTKRVKKAANECGIRLSWDEQGRINNITYGEAIKLLDYLGFTAMNLKEYWNVLKDARIKKDRQMIQHLQSNGFVEFLHTIIEDREFIVDKPDILETKSTFRYEDIDVEVNYDYRGKKQKAKIPEGKPGLIPPEDINLKTGLPKKVYGPGLYKNPNLWRYWSPDAEKNIATRGYIFLIGTPALDLKVHLSEAFHCLGIRPCCKKVELPEVKITESKEGVTVVIRKGEEFSEIRESEFFAKASD